MGEVTRETCRFILEGFESKKGFPLTQWEQAQLAYAWLERQDRREGVAASPSPVDPGDGGMADAKDADSMDAFAKNGLAWAVSRWNAEVANRPLVNVHRRTLDDSWRQVIRYFGGDPVKLIGPSHDDLLAINQGNGGARD